MSEKIDESIWPLYRALVPKGEEPDPEDVDANRIRHDIILAYLYLAEMVVKKRKKTLPKHVDADDLESWAYIGLLQAVQRYDHTMGVPFEAFVTQRMRSVIADSIRENDWAPRSLRKKQRDLVKAVDSFRQAEGRDPSDEELSQILEIPVESIRETRYKADIATHTYLELYTQYSGDHTYNVKEPASTTKDEDDESELIQILKTVLAESLTSMTPRKAAIIAMHYYQEMKLSDVAKALRMTEVKVGKLHQEAVNEIWQNLLSAAQNEE